MPGANRISIHVPLAGDDGPCPCIGLSAKDISIHVPLAGDDSPAAPCCKTVRYFYPRPPCGGRPRYLSLSSSGMLFLSTSPLRGTTGQQVADGGGIEDFYPRPPCGGRPGAPCGAAGGWQRISIHVPLAGDDYAAGRENLRGGAISIHVPLAGDD